MNKHIIEKGENNSIKWYLRLPVLIILFFAFPPISTIFSIVLFMKRLKSAKDNPKIVKRTKIELASICTICVMIVIAIIISCNLENKRLNEINAAIDSGDYITADILLAKEYEKDYVPYSIIKAKARMYEEQGLYNEAANVILEDCESKDDKTLIYGHTIEQLEAYKTNCDEGIVQRIDELIASRNQQIMLVENKIEAAKAAKEQEKAQKKAEKETAKIAKEQAKAQKDAKVQAANATKNQHETETNINTTNEQSSEKLDKTQSETIQSLDKNSSSDVLSNQVNTATKESKNVPNGFTYDDSEFAELDIINNTWYFEKDGSLLITNNFKKSSEGIISVIKFGYGKVNVMEVRVLCTLDSSNHAIGYDDGSNLGGIAKYVDDFKEGTENYIELMVKDSQLYMSIHAKGEDAEYDLLECDKGKDLHKSLIDSIFR